MIQVFGKKVLPELTSLVPQIGVKECFHDNWELFYTLPVEVRIIVLARDPRDVMLSVLDYGDQVEWHRKMWADMGDEYIVRRHLEIWTQQKEILRQPGVLPLRYEDFCQRPELFAEVCQFCSIPLDKPSGAAGAIERYPWRDWEIKKHKMKDVTTLSVFRWRLESNDERRRRALNVGRLMREYCEFWGYEC